MLTDHEILLIVVVIGMFVLIFATRLKIELVALLMMLTLSLTGLVSTQQAFSGFSSNVVITLIGLFVITKALEETGVAHWIAEALNNLGQGSEVRLVSLFMLAGATLSLVMNNVAAGAVMLPAAVRVGRVSGVRPSKLLMPMAFGTLVGGMATYLTTANIVMGGLLEERGLKGLGMVDFIPTGGLIVFAGLVAMLTFGRRMLPSRESFAQALTQPNLRHTYQLDERIWQVQVLAESRVAGKTIGESGIGEKLGLTVLSIRHGRNTTYGPGCDHKIRASDILLIVGRKERVEKLVEWGTRLLDDPDVLAHSRRLNVEPVEIVVAPRSNVVGQSLTQLRFRSQSGLTVVALWREGRSYRTDVGTMPLQVGDALLVLGKPEQVQALASTRDFIVPTLSYTEFSLRPEKAPYAIGITAVVLAVAILDLLPLPQMMIAGAAAMVLSGCLTMEEFYKAIEWRVIFLVAGMLPLSIAIADTGMADRLGGWVITHADSPMALIGAMTVLTVLITQVIGGQVAALLVGPVAINAALQMGVNPQAMSVAVAIACSMAFITPIAHPVNILIMGPGGYEPRDFLKIGVLMTVIALLALLLGLILFWNIR